MHVFGWPANDRISGFVVDDDRALQNNRVFRQTAGQFGIVAKIRQISGLFERAFATPL